MAKPLQEIDHKLWQAVCLKEKHAFPCVKTRVGNQPFHYQKVVILQPRMSMIHGLPVGGRDFRNSSNSFTSRWRVFSSEVEKVEVVLLLLEVSFIFFKKKQKSSHNTVCITYKAKSRWQVYWSVLENKLANQLVVKNMRRSKRSSTSNIRP